MLIKNLLKNKIILTCAIFVFSFLFFGVNNIYAASLKINSSATTLAPGQSTTLYVVVNSEGVSINNAEATITFDPSIMDVLSVSKGGSVFSLWVEEPYFSNSSGVITFNGGVPTPGYNGSSGPVISIVVRAKKAGQAEFNFSSSAVRANDGLGTDVLVNKQGKIISITAKEETIVEEIVQTAPILSTNTSLQISSPTHAVQDKWYKDKDPIYRWLLPKGVEAIQTAIDNNRSGSPRVVYTPPIKEKSIRDLTDGIWYFKARARSGGIWGPTSTYIVRIDSTPPINNNVEFIYDDQTKILTINSSIVDETSGVDYYEVYINNVFFKKVSADEFLKNNNFEINNSGENTVKFIAFDHAGNTVESVGNFTASGFIKKEEVKLEQEEINKKEELFVTIGKMSMPISYAITIFSLFSFLLLICGYYFGKNHNAIRRKLNAKSSVLKGDHKKVLLSLKKRLERHLEIMQDTRHSRILSKEEKAIKEAIEMDLDEVDKALSNES